ncbi:AfsR/SARP family transcriptional regulator [Planctomonas deserti]|uniref:AfsR/SARP family transcriptional regulator n=1 Tax=Planctomonas deserti TaxID=2144185 RepID=UPI000D3BD76F|nr:BTAD domain-containing putative transcriptional regulator [Planctomonas deserti]
MTTTFGVLGPVAAWSGSGAPLELKGPRHRAVLGRLLAARGRVVPLDLLIDDLWEEPPASAAGAIRTFVGDLRRALEPERPPRAAPRLLVTDGPGYALRPEPEDVDAWRFERVLSRPAGLPAVTAAAIEDALSWWRGPAYADFADEPWARAERSRLLELRLTAVERLAEARMAMGRAADAVPDLDAHVTDHPWREDAWRLLALVLYRAGRQGDALAVLRRARDRLARELGIDPGPALAELETDILRQAAHLALPPAPSGPDDVWARATAAYDRTLGLGARARLESTVGLLRTLAVTGGAGLEAAREQRLGTIHAAEQVGDPELTARVVGSFDVPGVWTRSDEQRQAGEVVTAAERALAGLAGTPGQGHLALRARLLATIAVESRGVADARGGEAAVEAERLARRLDDPALLAFALGGVFLQNFSRAGLAERREAVGAELIALSQRHGLATSEILGRLVRMQARGALGDFAAADEHALAADTLAERHERPLVHVFTSWYRAMRLTATGADAASGDAGASPEDAGQDAEAAYRAAARGLEGAGMPGLERGILPLAILCLRVWRGRPLSFAADTEWGPYEPWVRPLLLIEAGRRTEAAVALRRAPEPPPDLLLEALWCLLARAAIDLNDQPMMRRARAALEPASGEIAGAGSGMLTVGPVALHLRALDAALDASHPHA